MNATHAAYTLIVLLLIYIVYRGSRPVPPRPNSTMLRRTLRSRMRTKGVPRLCGYHLGSTLRAGQMAIVDSKRCEACIKEGRVDIS